MRHLRATPHRHGVIASPARAPHSRLRRRYAPVVTVSFHVAWLGAVAALFTEACRPAAAPSSPSTAVIEESVDLAAVFGTQLPLNNTFYAARKPELFKRVLVAPSLVFVGSRPSTPEPLPAASQGAADDESAVSDAVEIRLSTLLLDYLAQRGANLVIPAALVRWSGLASGTCSDACPSGARSWVERAIVAPKLAAADELSKVPTVVLVLRALGRSTLPLSVVAVRDTSKQTIVVRPRSLGSRDALCLWTAHVPVISFSAEIVDPADGRLVARIDEHRIPKVRSDFERTVTIRDVDGEASRDLVVGAEGSLGLCVALREQLDIVAHDVTEQASEALDLTVDELLRSTLDPLMKQ